MIEVKCRFFELRIHDQGFIVSVIFHSDLELDSVSPRSLFWYRLLKKDKVHNDLTYDYCIVLSGMSPTVTQIFSTDIKRLDSKILFLHLKTSYKHIRFFLSRLESATRFTLYKALTCPTQTPYIILSEPNEPFRSLSTLTYLLW